MWFQSTMRNILRSKPLNKRLQIKAPLFHAFSGRDAKRLLAFVYHFYKVLNRQSCILTLHNFVIDIICIYCQLFSITTCVSDFCTKESQILLKQDKMVNYRGLLEEINTLLIWKVLNLFQANTFALPLLCKNRSKINNAAKLQLI